MKKILLLLFVPLLFGCGKDTEDKPIEDELPYERRQMYAFFDELGIKPSDRDSISYFGGLVDGTSYKLALGRKSGHAWLAKFNSSGDEVFSFEVKEAHPDTKYSHFNSSSIIYTDDDVLFLRGWHSNIEHFPNMDDGTYYTFLSMIDIQGGKELKRFEFVPGNGLYQIEKVFDAYFVSEGANTDALTNPNAGRLGYQIFYIIKDGNVLWERKCADHEGEGIDYYRNHIFLDYERIAYSVAAHDYFYEQVERDPIRFCRIINLKNLTPLHEISTEDFPFNVTKGNYCPVYKIYDMNLSSNGIIQIFYKEFEFTYTYNPIIEGLQQHENEIDSYRYDITLSDYSVLRHVRLSDMREIEIKDPDNIRSSTLRIAVRWNTVSIYFRARKNVMITSLKLSGSDGGEPVALLDYPQTDTNSLDIHGYQIDKSNPEDIWAEIEFVYNGEIYRIRSEQ